MCWLMGIALWRFERIVRLSEVTQDMRELLGDGRYKIQLMRG